MATPSYTEKDLLEKVPALREAFNKEYADSISKDVYDERDLQRFNTDDVYATCFLRTIEADGDVPKALPGLNESLKFRKTMGVNDLKEDEFPKDWTTRKAMYYKGADVDGNPIMYIDVKQNNASGAEQVKLLKKYIAFHFDMHYSQTPGQKCVVLLDMSGASVSHINIDVTKFIISCLTTYFPGYLAYMINYDMPFLLSATWKVIQAFLSAKQKQTLRMVKKKDIGNFIPEEHLWDHMKPSSK